MFSTEQRLTTNIKECQRLKKANPDLSDELDKKIRHKSHVLHILDDEGRVAVLLDNLGKQFHEIEARLEQSKMGNVNKYLQLRKAHILIA